MYRADHLGLGNLYGVFVPRGNWFLLSQYPLTTCSSSSVGRTMWNFPCPYWHDNYCCHYIGFVQATILLRVQGCISKVDNGRTQVLWRGKIEKLGGFKCGGEKEEGEYIAPRMFKKTWGIMLFYVYRELHTIHMYICIHNLLYFIHLFVYSFHKSCMALSLDVSDLLRK